MSEKLTLPGGIWTLHDTRPLGDKGGFGQVFEGESDGGDVVAIKRLHVDADSAAHRELRIAQDLAGHEHKHVIPVHDSGEFEGRYYIVMARAEGSLQDSVARGPIAEADAIKVLLQITSGLSEVSDIVHRDLKPGNVLYHEGLWKLADFGIARFVEESTSAATLKHYLSVLYAAPEQLRMERAAHATDVYALGCVAFALLTGSPPFVGSAEEVVQGHLHAPPPELKGASPMLRSLILGCLSKSMAARPALNQVRARLERAAETPERKSGPDPIAVADAAVAEKQAKEEALSAQEQKTAWEREQLARDAEGQLSLILDQLMDGICDRAKNAERLDNPKGIHLGAARLLYKVVFRRIDKDAFEHAQWADAVVGTVLILSRDDTEIQSANLWYADVEGRGQYRWYEVSYRVSPFGSKRSNYPEPWGFRSPGELEQAVKAVGRAGGYPLQLSTGPKPIDGEGQEGFVLRWEDLLSKVVT